MKIVKKENSPLKVEQDRSKLQFDEDDDTLCPEQLELLATSPKLTSLLKNPHLRQILTDLDVSAQKDKLIDCLMREPIFIEFADTCLECLDI